MRFERHTIKCGFEYCLTANIFTLIKNKFLLIAWHEGPADVRGTSLSSFNLGAGYCVCVAFPPLKKTQCPLYVDTF
jgi:hypothetical protein